MSDLERLCPECGDRLAREARACACGWGKRRGAEKAGKQTDMRCTYRNGSDRCDYPVGMFPEGAASGWCIFHREAEPTNGSEILRQSHRVEYAEALKAIIHRNANTPYVRAARERMKRTPGNTGPLLPRREPGQDESEAAA